MLNYDKSRVWPWTSLDPEFEEAVQIMARERLPGGTFIVGEDAPQTYEEVCAHLDTGRVMRVWSGASDQTIYSRPQANYAFRAWHDHEHWVLKQPFTWGGEAETTWSQAEQITKRFHNHPRIRKWRNIIFCEVMGQIVYADRHGAFPENQRLFFKKFMQAFEDPEDT